MNAKESDIIHQLLKSIQELKIENQKFRDDVTSQVTSLKEKVFEKHLPLNLENDVNHIIKNSISTALNKFLVMDYDSPLKKYVIKAVEKQSKDLQFIFDELFSREIHRLEFIDECKEVFHHKVAKSILVGLDSTIDSMKSDLKNNKEFNAKLFICVTNLIKEFQK